MFFFVVAVAVDVVFFLRGKISRNHGQLYYRKFRSKFQAVNVTVDVVLTQQIMQKRVSIKPASGKRVECPLSKI